ncbi:hypothetical protein KC19_7G083100 [Ceratodon purpureus]|uniref:Uncharacterized protein n=1 Tax=Ceratodon purpureus TaxID=3225 RepID=A0A8T0H5W9_CERPU|nr:hypothetical protein KC19_7G083100 [Ceratodon purpureus]
MSKELVGEFFPETFNGFLKDHAPWLYDFLLPDWVAERCPMPSIDLQIPGVSSPVKLFWPVVAIVILTGFISSLFMGTRMFLRVQREGSSARQGLFVWSCSLLSYACMCCGGFFFHCLHIRTIPHMLDLVGTGLSSLSAIAGFAAYTGKLDDRTPAQRLRLLLCALAFIAVAFLSPPLLQEQLYIVPSLLATFAGVSIVRKSSAKIRTVGLTTRLQEAHREAHRWLKISGLGVVVGLACVSLDKFLCVNLGANFSLVFWFFLGCNLAILSANKFALVAADNNLHFTDLKSQ